MVDPLSYFLLQPVLHDWFNKDRGMCYPDQELLLLIEKSSQCGSSVFPLSLSGPLPYVRRHISVNNISLLQQHDSFIHSSVHLFMLFCL